MKSWIFGAIAVAMLVGCNANAQPYQDQVASRTKPSAPPLLGGWTEQNPEDAMIKEAAAQTQSLLRAPEWLKDAGLTVSKVANARTQVVAGTNYRLVVELLRKGKSRGADVVLFQNLQGGYSLSSVALGAPGSPATYLEGPTARAVPGGFTEQTVGSEEQTMAQKACTLLRGADWLDDASVTLVKANRAMTQVVAGLNYYLEMDVTSGVGKRSVQVLLYHDLKGNDSLTWARFGEPTR